MNKNDRRLFHNAKHEKNNQKRLASFIELYQRHENDYRIIFELLKTLGTFPEYREKVKTILPLLEKKYNPSTLYFELGKLEMMDKNYDCAIENFKVSLFYIDNNLGSAFEIGKAYLGKGDKLSAKEKFLDLAINYNDKASYYELGVLKEEESDLYNAQKYYKKVLEIDNKDERALFRLGKIEKQKGNFYDAKEYFLKFYEINKKDIYNLLELGKIEAELGNNEEAKSYFEEALKIKEESSIYLNLGVLEEKLGNFNQAINNYYKALNCDNDKFVFFKLGCIFKQLKRFPEAKRYFSKISDTEMKHTAMLENINILLKEEKIEEAMELYNELINSELNENTHERDIKRVGVYLKYKLGERNFDYDNELNSYIEQLLEYDEKRSILNSKVHFEENFDFEKALDIARNNLTEDNFSNTRSGLDYYIIDYGYFTGYENKKETTKICVATILNTDKIMFMRPAAKERLNLEEKKRVRIK